MNLPDTIFADDDDDGTATTADLTTLDEQFSDEEYEDEDEEFAVENLPRPPPERMLYNGEGTSSVTTVQAGRDITTEEDERAGRSNNPSMPGHRQAESSGVAGSSHGNDANTNSAEISHGMCGTNLTMPEQRHGASSGVAEHAPSLINLIGEAYEATSSLSGIIQAAQQGTAGSSHGMNDAK